MKKKILKIHLTNNKNIYPTEEESKLYDLYVNKYGIVFDKNMKEVNDFSFSYLEYRQVLDIYFVGIEENIHLSQILTIQQIDILKYMYKYFGIEIKLISDIIKDTSLFKNIVK